MEHLATKLGVDPLDFRMKNFLKKGDLLVTGNELDVDNPLPDIIEKLKASSNFETRKQQVEKFNRENKWRKRGIVLIPAKYGIGLFPLPYYCHVINIP